MTAARRGQKAAFSPTAMSTIVKLPAVWPTLSHASTIPPAPPKRAPASPDPTERAA